MILWLFASSNGNISKLFSQIPMKKSQEDIEFYIKTTPKFCQIIQHIAHRITNKKIRTPYEAEQTLKFLCREEFTEYTFSLPFIKVENNFGDIFGHSICVSVNDCAAHGFNLFKDGDIVSIDAGLYINDNINLNFDLAVTTVVGGVDYKDQWIKAPETALKRIIEQQPKDTMQISRIIQDVAEQEEQSIIISLTGHGIGRYLHEAPYIYNKTGQFHPYKLFNGMVFCVEPIFVESPSEKLIEDTYLDHDNWSVKTMSKRRTSHFETMFCFWDDNIIDLTESLKEGKV